MTETEIVCVAFVAVFIVSAVTIYAIVHRLAR